MIVFDLKCGEGHTFEAWFKSSSAYQEQREMGLVTCPFCDSAEITKAPMAPNIAAKGNQKAEATKAQEPQNHMAAGDSGELSKMVAEAEKFLTGVRQHVEKNFEDVGNNFAEEARKIHYGEAEERGIYGESTKEETVELMDEGINVLPIPMPKKADA
ncbi:DUF1178 family protein [Kordiimonas sp. SCSIO 12603]|uniref:DUF1178 family protein n=1 Tax=Kordiimonas sp. SCSIO 12603 TaxID=2829596 RepID=UPI002104F09C|nr:DUF1178 family protein [Kordiimonas sp. SCSIO 12603]UTW59490.1 DUF1178 family protein [Kordiimonas sp. SCSIO 12603]